MLGLDRWPPQERLDDKSYLQRYTPRTKKRIWSQINVDNVARLIGEGRMTDTV